MRKSLYAKLALALLGIFLVAAAMNVALTIYTSRLYDEEATQKLRDRVNGPPVQERDASTTSLGDWFATALFWRPHVALLVNQRTLLPVFLELAPAATLLDRVPEAIESVLEAHGIDDGFVALERDAMRDVRIGPTNDRSVVGGRNVFFAIAASGSLPFSYQWRFNGVELPGATNSV